MKNYKFIVLFSIVLVCVLVWYGTTSKEGVVQPQVSEDIYYRVMSEDEYADDVRILFCGDLILLEDQVKLAYKDGSYDFASLFEYTKEYIESADYAMGVFEGVCGGAEFGYSSSNYDDYKTLYVNYPDEFAYAVKDAGFDLVTLANNHLLDAGIDGAKRTVEVLDSLGLDNIGAFDNHIKFVAVKGINIAILSYTYGINGYDENEILGSNITSLLVPADSENYDSVFESIKQDFESCKSHNADVIVVLPHWGEQFLNKPDEFQQFWQEKFIEFGADVILGDHSHSVEPVFIDSDNKFTLYCPGNYTNVYREHNGDCSSLVEVYIDAETKQVTGGSIIPMWICAQLNGNYRPLPIYKVYTDEVLRGSLTTYDLTRVNEVFKHITKTMLGVELDASLIQERYFFDADGFKRLEVPVVSGYRNQELVDLLTNSKRVCFVGDSITEGTRNGGIPWFEPLRELYSEAINCGHGSATVSIIRKNYVNEIIESDADLYIIALGANDIRYRNDDSAMTSEEYIQELKSLKSAISGLDSEASYVFIAPWISTDGDLVSAVPYKEKLELYKQYTDALSDWCASTGDLCINPNIALAEMLRNTPDSVYMIDYIHPNARGVVKYAEAVLSYES